MQSQFQLLMTLISMSLNFSLSETISQSPTSVGSVTRLLSHCYQSRNDSFLPEEKDNFYNSAAISMDIKCVPRIGYPYPFCVKIYEETEEGLQSKYACLHTTTPPKAPPQIGVSLAEEGEGYCISPSHIQSLELHSGNLTAVSWMCLCFSNYCNKFEFGSRVDPRERILYQILLHKPGAFVAIFLSACVSGSFRFYRIQVKNDCREMI